MKKLFILLLALIISLLCFSSCDFDLDSLLSSGEGGGESEGGEQNGDCLHENTHITKEAIAPTCVTAGRTAEISCLDCNEIVTQSQILQIDESAHGTLIEIPEVPATCSVIGSTAGKKCSLCDATVVFPSIITKAPHTWVIEESTPVSCTKDGYIGGVVCSECGFTPTEAMINSAPSLYPEGATVSKVLPMYGHYEGAGEHITVLEEEVPSTCTQTGYTAELYCSICNSTVEKEVIPKAPHAYGSNGTCTAAGCSDVADYLGKNVSFLGDSITSYDGYTNNASYNTTLPQNGYYYSSSKLAVSSTWWHLTMSALNLNLCVNNSVDAGRVTNTKANVTSGIDRAKNLHNDNNGAKPDIIVIYLGTNDLANGIADYEFEAGYKLMLQNIRASYPEAEVFCCTLLPESRTPSTKALVAYNDIIKSCAELYGYESIDLYSELSGWSYSKYTISDGTLRVHPTSAGMDLIGDAVIDAIKAAYGKQD